MKYRRLIVAAAIAAAGQAQAAGVGVRAGTTGIGADFGWDVAPTLGGRIGISGGQFNTDVDTSNVRYDAKAKRVTENREHTDTTLRIVAWGQDADGEVYALDFVSGGIYQLAPTPDAAKTRPPFPRKLSETGLFASTRGHTPAKGLIPYSVNAELWSDGAIKERYIAVPGDARIEYETVTYPQPAQLLDVPENVTQFQSGQLLLVDLQ